MRLALTVLTTIAAASVLSCADFPTKPLETVSWGGRVLDRDGAPMAGVFVSIGWTRQGQTSHYVVADSQGTFEVALVEGPYRVTLYPPLGSEYPSRYLGILEIHQGTTPLEYRYVGTRVSGTVTGPGGAAIERAYVVAYTVLDGDFLPVDASTNAAGGYSFVVPPADYRFEVGAGTSGVVTRSLLATVSATDTTIDFDLGGHEIRYLATLNGSLPLSVAQVEAETAGLRALGMTGPDGRAKLYLPDGTYTVLVRPGVPSGYMGWAEQFQQTVSGSADIPVDLVRTRWDVTVRWSATGSPIPYAYILALNLDAGGSGSVTADNFGRATFLIPPDTYELRVYPTSSTSSPWKTTIAAGADSAFDLLVPPPPTPATP